MAKKAKSWAEYDKGRDARMAVNPATPAGMKRIQDLHAAGLRAAGVRLTPSQHATQFAKNFPQADLAQKLMSPSGTLKLRTAANQVNQSTGTNTVKRAVDKMKKMHLGNHAGGGSGEQHRDSEGRWD